MTDFEMSDVDESQSQLTAYPRSDPPAGSKTLSFAARFNGVDLYGAVTFRWGEEDQSSMDSRRRDPSADHPATCRGDEDF